MRGKIKTIFLDAGGTLFRPYPSVGAVYAATARKHGHRFCEAEDLEKRFHSAWHHTNGLASLRGKSTAKIERDWWHQLVKQVFAGEEKHFDDFEAFFEELFDVFARPEVWRLFDDTVPVLESLRQKGFRLAMVSNWDHRLESIVKGLGIMGYFDAIYSSSGVGVAKPGAQIFETALKGLQARAEETVHVGDSLEDDYHGARNAGLEAVLLNRPGKAYNDVRYIHSLHDLLSLL